MICSMEMIRAMFQQKHNLDKIHFMSPFFFSKSATHTLDLSAARQTHTFLSPVAQFCWLTVLVLGSL